MPTEIAWSRLFVSILIGLCVGVLVPIVAIPLGLPRGWIAPVIGALTGTLIPLIYRLQAKRGSTDRS